MTKKKDGVVVRLDVVMTRQGDNGWTTLANKERVPKHAPVVEAIGALDEANAAVGMLRGFLSPEHEVYPLLLTVQHHLFDLGRIMADAKVDLVFPVENVLMLERAIEDLRNKLPPLTSFVLPGNGPLDGIAHMARVIIRRAERALSYYGPPINVIPYVNRLSDLMFLVARYLAERDEELWRPGIVLRWESLQDKIENRFSHAHENVNEG